jgi:DNA-binding XRE family transcriptional regulator
MKRLPAWLAPPPVYGDPDMKYPEYSALAKSARSITELSQGSFGELIKTAKRTLVDWEAGNAPPNGAAVVLLHLIADRVISADAIRNLGVR